MLEWDTDSVPTQRIVARRRLPGCGLHICPSLFLGHHRRSLTCQVSLAPELALYDCCVDWKAHRQGMWEPAWEPGSLDGAGRGPLRWRDPIDVVIMTRSLHLSPLRPSCYAAVTALTNTC